VLTDGDTVVWESHAILRYVAASYGAGSLWSADPAARSRADRWMDWSQCTLQPAVMSLFWGHFRTPSAQRDAALLKQARSTCIRVFDALDAELTLHPFLGGDSLSLADIPAGTALYRYFEMGVTVPHPPHVERWYAALASREPYRAAVMVPFEELRGRLEF
jgi:glutathione S-transferase